MEQERSIASLAEQYRRQDRWRRWDEVLTRLPLTPGQRVLDLGCGVGQMAARLNRLGVEVVGIDWNEELLTAARVDHPGIRFVHLDLHGLTPDRFGHVDGLWASFVAAYFPDLEPVLARWCECLRPGGWLALVEIDDLFGHEPLPSRFRDEVLRFYDEARRARRYDFEAGRKLPAAARAVGLDVVYEGTLPDDELAFDGAAAPDVLQAWRERLQRIPGLKTFMHERFDDYARTFLATLASPDHRSTARVCWVVARRGEDGSPGSRQRPP
jgi:SAM-dependent methyltransferase